jgi:hypothetical protein
MAALEGRMLALIDGPSEAVFGIHGAAEHGDAEAVSRMLDEDPQLLLSELYNDTLLTRAAKEGHVGMVTHYLL